MKDNDLDKKVDEWLDKACAEYGKSDIRPGFERRIIAKVNSRLETRRRFFHWIPATVSAATVLFFSGWLIVTRFREPALPETAFRQTTIVESVVQPGADNRSIPQKPTEIWRRSPAATALSRRLITAASMGKGLLDGPASEQERVLLAYVRSGSFEFPDDSHGEKAVQPIEIPETDIQALEIPKTQVAFTKIEPIEINTEESEARP